MKNRSTRLAGTLPALLLLAPLHADQDPPSDAMEIVRERMDMPPLEIVGERPTSPAAQVGFGNFIHVQANVDDGGSNVLGDAGNEPSLAVDPTAPNRIAAGWRQFDTVLSSFRQAGYAYSRDGGRTWSGQQVIEPGLFRSDPVLGEGPDGTLYYLSLHVNQFNEFICDMFISTDGGATWPSKSFAFGGDKAWFAIDPTDGVGAGNIYQAWNIAGNLYAPAQFNRSLTGGTIWMNPIEYDPTGTARPVFGILDVGPDGAVYVTGAAGVSSTFWVVKSISAQVALGATQFEQIVQVDLGGSIRLAAGPNPSGLLGQVGISVDRSGGPTHGNVYVLCSVDPPGSDPLNVNFIRSEDGGLTWTSPMKVNDDAEAPANWQWFGTMSVAPNGRIDVVWNDTRNSGVANISALYYSASFDGGETWTPNEQISPSFDSHVGWPQQNKLGDYYDMVSDKVGAHLIWAATFNGEQDVYYTRIGDYDCNDNGIGDAIDLASRESLDCNGNDTPDECEIAAGESDDENGNGIPDECECPGDANGDLVVDVQDLVEVILQWGPCDAPCSADFNQDDVVDVLDLLDVILQWGEC